MLEKNLDGMMHMDIATATKAKRRRTADQLVQAEEEKGKGNKVCTVVQKYSVDSLQTVGQKKLQQECKMHDIRIYGTVADLRKRLRAHFNSVAHSHKPGGAAPDDATTYYNSRLTVRAKQGTMNDWLNGKNV